MLNNSTDAYRTAIGIKEAKGITVTSDDYTGIVNNTKAIQDIYYGEYEKALKNF